MVRAGRSSGEAGGAAASVAAVGAALALALAARSAAATDVDTSCTPMDLTAMNVTDYIRWSNSSNRLYLENGACVTMTEIYESRKDKKGNNPVLPFDETTKRTTDTITGSWYLSSDLYVEGGSKLLLQGSSWGGDCDHLLLASSPGATPINLRAHGGDIMLYDTHVETWDMAAGGVHEDYEGGRSYISAISEVIVEGGATCLEAAKKDMGESRLDIIDSEVNHLGYDAAESYGIAYKVRGFCKDLSNPEIFDLVSVYGDILGSDIHHNYFGHYSYGHEGGNWSYNEMHDNIGYGFDPHDDSDGLTIHNNHVYNNGWHGIIASKRCDHVSIQNNHVHDNGQVNVNGQRIGNGIMLHRSSNFATVKNNTVHGNFDSGVALFESFNCEVSDNIIYGNKNAIRMSLGSSDNLVWNNKMMIHGPESKYVIYMYQGSDVPDVGDGRPTNNHIFDNTLISDDEVAKMLNADDNVIEGNVIYGRFSRFEDTRGTLWKSNFLPDGMHEFKMSLDSCHDPDSDMVLPEYNTGEPEGASHSNAFDYGDGFFCSSGSSGSSGAGRSSSGGASSGGDATGVEGASSAEDASTVEDASSGSGGDATGVEGASSIENASTAEETPVVEDAATSAEDAATSAEDAATSAEDTTGAEEVTVIEGPSSVEDATSDEDATVVEDAASPEGSSSEGEAA